MNVSASSMHCILQGGGPMDVVTSHSYPDVAPEVTVWRIGWRLEYFKPPKKQHRAAHRLSKYRCIRLIKSSSSSAIPDNDRG